MTDRNTCFDIQDAIIAGELSFAQIAAKHGVSVEDVEMLNDELNDQYDDDSTDEDYDGQPDEAQEWHDFDPDC